MGIILDFGQFTYGSGLPTASAMIWLITLLRVTPADAVCGLIGP